ncbi:SET domain-containing protein [Lentithecium fluviatile CBS 122367]|uniref:SET domain-containing protein n=1 Tax=Lentithecium fluviatile CBS 122367 TaxID=1168545 RepID=A0A6G1J6A1_9PLEO|nr:SET domain-containing protein [Lentithecium fluviatile CBS 122367]
MSNSNVFNHSYRNLHIPIDAPLELKPSPGKGWGAFATRPITQGTIVLKETPLFIIHKPHEAITEQDLWTAFQALPPRDKQLFLCIRDNPSTPFASMTGMFAENSFALTRPFGHGLFPLHSRINHSCLPNCKLPDPAEGTTTPGDGAITCFATKDIAYGEEITFCYNTDFECRTRDDRYRELRFACNCKACTLGTPFQLLSDMRRTLIRGLQYLTTGTDLDGQKDSSQTPLIVDPDLKKDAETMSIPLSNRLVYSLLSMALVEQEGLMDEFTVRRMNPAILLLASRFRDKQNAEIAGAAMGREMWTEKFGVAVEMFGRGDVGFEEMLSELGIAIG